MSYAFKSVQPYSKFYINNQMVCYRLGGKKALYYILKYQKTKLCHLKPQKSLTQIGPTNNSNITVNNITILGRMQSGRICCITSTHQLWRLQRTNYLTVWHIKDSFDHAHIFWSFLFHKNGKISYLTMSMKTTCYIRTIFHSACLRKNSSCECIL